MTTNNMRDLQLLALALLALYGVAAQASFLDVKVNSSTGAYSLLANGSVLLSSGPAREGEKNMGEKKKKKGKKRKKELEKWMRGGTSERGGLPCY
jgi:hypothetical protein